MKTGKQRGGVSAAVLEAPEVGYASGVASSESFWRGQEPAPAGALQRGFGVDAAEPSNYHDEDEYTPRRGAFRPTMRGLFRSTAGRVVLGVGVVLLLGGMALGVALGRAYLLHDSRFMMAESDEIQISGNTHLTRAQLLSVFGGDLERNIFRVSLSDRQADLERLPWVQKATVMRLLPNQLRVQIVERTPVAFARQGTQIGLVDASGVLLDMSADSAGATRYSFPVLTGIVASDAAATRASRMAVYAKFMKELDGGGQRFSKTVSEVDVTDPDDLKAMVATGGPEILVHFGDAQFLSRYMQFEKLLPEWKQQYPKLASADMRYQGQIVLEMAKDRGVGVEEGGAKSAVAGTTATTAAAPVQVAKVKPTVPAAVVAPAVVVPKAKAVAVKAPVKKTTKPVVKKVSAKAGKVAVKPAVGHVARSSGSSAANDKVFAALAAQRKAQTQ